VFAVSSLPNANVLAQLPMQEQVPVSSGHFSLDAAEANPRVEDILSDGDRSGLNATGKQKYDRGGLVMVVSGVELSRFFQETDGAHASIPLRSILAFDEL